MLTMHATYKLLLLLVIMLLVCLFPARVDAGSYCYGARYNATVVDFSTTWKKGIYNVTVNTDDGSAYTLRTTRYFTEGKQYKLDALVCVYDGIPVVAPRSLK